MDFCSALRLLGELHEQECAQRQLVEVSLETLRRELQQLQKQGATISELSSPRVVLAFDNGTPQEGEPCTGIFGKDVTSGTLVGIAKSPGAPPPLHKEHSDFSLSGRDTRAERSIISPQTSSRTVHMLPSGGLSMKNSTGDISSLGRRSSSSSSPESNSCAVDDFHSEMSGMSGAETSDLDELAMMKGWKRVQQNDRRKKHREQTRRAETQSVKVKTFQRRLKQILTSRSFDFLSAGAICLNSVLIGVCADYAARNTKNGESVTIPYFFKAVERVFTLIFLLELLLKLCEGPHIFFCGPNRNWNVFDFLVVSGDIIQTSVEVFFHDWGLDLKMLRMLRVVRITRAIRVIRLVRFFKELRMMVYAIMRCGTSLLWAMLLFLIIMYIFGVFLMNAVTDHVGEGTLHAVKLQEYFGSLDLTVYTMYACMSGGYDWTEIGNALIRIHWFHGFALAFYVFFTIFIVSNILTGIFVDTAIQSALNDRDEIVQEQIDSKESELMMLKQAFEDTDEDKSGSVTQKEFQEHLRSEKCRALFSVIGIEVHEAYGLFKLLDQDHSGEVSIEEFVMGCMRLKGEAKSIDLATLMYENKRLIDRFHRLEVLCKTQFEELQVHDEKRRQNFAQQEAFLLEQFGRLQSNRSFLCGDKFRM